MLGWLLYPLRFKVMPLSKRSAMTNRLTDLAERAGFALKEAHATLATAESCTGGGIAEAITRIAGSSAWFERGWVTYSNPSKQQELGVDRRLIEEQGAVSGAVVRAMAEGARLRSGATWTVAVSGIAGPDGGSQEKPVGTVWLAWSGPGGTDAERHVFQGDRSQIRAAAVEKALGGLCEKIMLASGRRPM